MRYLSLFSGIEACTQAWHPLGWECVGVAEIDPFPCAVLAHHYPDTPNLGSVTDITDSQIGALGPIDLVVGGSPCQDLSVAGKRAGFDGERSSLFFEQMRIFHATRRLCGARWLLWENVPGAFSSNRGADFAAVVSEMAGCEFGVPGNGWQSAGAAVGQNGLCEWRMLDAQYFGLAQRRKRVFALLDTGDWRGRPPVLLEPEGMRGNPAPSREAGKKAAREPSFRTFSGSRESDVAATLETTCNDYSRADGFTVALHQPSVGAVCARTGRSMSAQDAQQGHIIPVAFHPTQDPINSTEVCHSLGTTSSGTAAIAFAQNQRGELRTDDVVGALSTGGGRPGHGYPAVAVAGTLKATDGGFDIDNAAAGQAVSQNMAVRRLTPVECERLQGFPDNFTQIPYRNKPAEKCPDGPRYKALGNSMAVPVMAHIGRRIGEVTA